MPSLARTDIGVRGSETMHPCYSRGMDTANILAFSEADQKYIIRAAAHSAAPLALPEEARFRYDVTDLQVARVILAAIRGAVVHRIPSGHWMVQRPVQQDPMPALALTGIGPMLSPIVKEMLRTGLATRSANTFRLAPTHLRSQIRTQPRCFFSGRTNPLRARLVDEPMLVECAHCQRIYAYRAPFT